MMAWCSWPPSTSTASLSSSRAWSLRERLGLVDQQRHASVGDPYAVLPGEPAASADDNGTQDTTSITDGSNGDGDGDGQGDDPDQPKRPRGNAPRPEWAAYAVGLGVATADDAAKAHPERAQGTNDATGDAPPDPGAE
jgi:hypothetical protein